MASFLENVFGGGGQTTTTTSAPWKPQQKPIKRGFTQAGKLFTRGMKKGKNPFRAYPGDTTIDFSQPTQQSLDMAQQLALGPNKPNEWAMGGLEKLFAGGNYSQIPQIQALMGEMPDAWGTYGTDIASGANKIGTEGDYRALMESGGATTEAELRDLLSRSGNEAWKGHVDTEAARIADDINAQYGSAGRYGSGMATGALTQGVGDFRQKALAEEFDRNAQRERGLLGDITGLEERESARRAGLLGDITGVQGQNIQNIMSAATGLSGEQLAALNAKRGLIGDITGIEQQQIADMMGGIDRAAGVYEGQYGGAQHLGQVGSAYDDKNRRDLQAKIDRWTTNQMAPWQLLGAYQGAVGGPQSAGRTETQQVEGPFNPLGGALGGAMSGFQMGMGTPWAPWLAAGGAALGGLSNIDWSQF